MRILVTEQGKKEITSLSLSPINTRSLINKLETESVDYIQADNSQGFYQDNLMNSVYKCIHLDSISDALYKIEYYYSNMLGEEQKIIDLYKEEYSKNI